MLAGRRPQAELGARCELRCWTAAREYWDRAAGNLELAQSAADPSVRDRYLKIAQYYRTAAEAEERAANQSTDARLGGRDDQQSC
jgi:hypothetical protein